MVEFSLGFLFGRTGEDREIYKGGVYMSIYSALKLFAGIFFDVVVVKILPLYITDVGGLELLSFISMAVGCIFYVCALISILDSAMAEELSTSIPVFTSFFWVAHILRFCSHIEGCNTWFNVGLLSLDVIGLFFVTCEIYLNSDEFLSLIQGFIRDVAYGLSRIRGFLYSSGGILKRIF